MTQILDAIGIALSSIWVNKIRSLMMVLGQHRRGVVDHRRRVAAAGHERLRRRRDPARRRRRHVQGRARSASITDEEEEHAAWRRNPNVTMLDAKAIETFDPTIIDAVMAESGARANVTWGDRRSRATRVRGVSADYEEFSGYAAETGRLPSRDGSRTRAQRRRARLGHRRQAVQGPQPGRPGHPGQRHALHRCSASARRRARSSATRRTSSS